MKSVLTIFALVVSLSAVAECEREGILYQNGEQAVFYLVENHNEVGPNYTCASMGRVRTCEGNEWSKNVPECSEEDSGGCVDWWIDRLADSNFNATFCN